MNTPIPRRLRQDPEWYAAWGGPNKEPEPPHSWRCYLFGCRVPKRIGPGHDAVRFRMQGESKPLTTTFLVGSASGSWASGSCGPIFCERCGRTVYPFDRDYPMIEPR